MCWLFNMCVILTLHVQCHKNYSTLEFSDTHHANVAFGDSDGKIGIVDIIRCSNTPFRDGHAALVSSVHYGSGSRIVISGSFDQRGIV